ncbi:MAG: tail protein X [Fusobacteriaceae bacterium]|jgi:phage tail protein X|nr:tail protein X [Fusobacteriaceae bacterium]
MTGKEESYNTYETEQGDTWDLIAFKVYGQERRMVDLIDANIEFSNVVFFTDGILLIVPAIPPEEKEGVAPWAS